jgi:hypothetical protein
MYFSKTKYGKKHLRRLGDKQSMEAGRALLTGNRVNMNRRIMVTEYEFYGTTTV